jgi:hypothetical protein
VEVERNANFCSLCGEPLLENTSNNETFIKSGKFRREEKLLNDYQQLSGYQKRKIFWQISGLILVSGIIITLLIDFIANTSITWSKYPATVCLVLFINFTLNTFLRKRIILMPVLSFLSFTALFILFDIYIGDTGWEMKLGIPIILLAWVSVSFLVFLVRTARQKGLNVIAYSLIAAGVLGVCTDGMISVFSHNTVYFGWSLIVLVSLVFIATPLFYIHYRLKKATDLKRFFHI